MNKAPNKQQGLILKQFNIFEQHTHNEAGVEFWYARDLMKLLGYSTWDKFLKGVVEKAMQACMNSEQIIEDHFSQVGKMIQIGKTAQREIKDIKLTRYACYLVSQNGDPKKVQVAFAQTYFALQTRKMEIIQERLDEQRRLEAREKLSENERRLSAVIYQRGIDNIGFGKFKTAGDKALFGGHNNKQMKERLGTPENRPLADYLPTVSIRAKDLANEITRVNVENKDLYGEVPLTSEHIDSNASVRKALTDRGIVPENLPPSEDVKKVKRRIKKEKKLGYKPDAILPNKEK